MGGGASFDFILFFSHVFRIIFLDNLSSYQGTLLCNETRDIHIPQIYPHDIPYNPTVSQTYMQKPTTNIKSVHLTIVKITLIHVSLVTRH